MRVGEHCDRNDGGTAVAGILVWRVGMRRGAKESGVMRGLGEDEI